MESAGSSPSTSQVVWNRVQGVLRLDPPVFAEIGADPSGVTQGLIVAAIAAAAANLWSGPFLVSSVLLYLLMAAGLAGLFSLVARMFAQGVPRYPAWLAAILFTTAPLALGIIPMFGAAVGSLYMVVLQFVAIRELGRITAGEAIMVLLIVLIPATVLFVMLGTAFGLAALLAAL